MKVHLRKNDKLDHSAACGTPIRRPESKAVTECAFHAVAEARCTRCHSVLMARIGDRLVIQDADKGFGEDED